MKQVFIFLCSLALSFSSSAQIYDWARGGGSNSMLAVGSYSVEATYKMCTDPHGNVYALSVAGYAAIYADTFYHAATGLNTNVLFTSHNCNGQMRFAKLISCAGPKQQGIVADSFGNIYLALDLPHNSTGSTILRIGNDTTITAFNYSTQALVKYDTTGRLKWIRFVGNNTPISLAGTGGDGNYVVLDSAQNPHLILNNYSGVVFRPGDTSIRGANDLKYDANGNLLTIKHLNFDSLLGVGGVTIDPSSNKLYVYGEKWVAYPAPPQYKFLAAFDTNRNLIWIDTLINPVSITYAFSGVVADGAGHLYTSAQGAGPFTAFKTDTAFNVIGAGGTNNFVMKTDTAGNVKWLTNLSSGSGSGLINLVMSPDKRKLAFGGGVLGKVKCDIDSVISYAGEATNPVFAVLDTAGYVHELQQPHAPGFSDGIYSSSFDRVGRLYVGGEVSGNIWGGSITPYSSVGGDSDYFIMKYGVDCNCASMPISDFTSVGTRTVNFTYTGTVGDSVRWYFGDGTTSTSLTPSHIYSASGTFTVRCWVYTPCGRDLKARKVIIPCTYPGGAAFTHTGIFSLSFNYTGSLTDVDSIRWKFGDGGTSPLVNPTHTYASPGTYNVCVKVYSWCMVDSFCTSVVVPCITSPTAALFASGTGPSWNFNYTGTTTGVSTYTWDYGDMSSPGSGSSTSHSYAAIGIYTVCVTASNPCGTNTYCTTINVTCMTTPVWGLTKTGALATKNFAYTAVTPGADSVHWNFGDGGQATGFTPSHTYGSVGIFTVCAVMYSQCGNDTACDTVLVPCLAPATANFTFTGTIHDSTKNFSYTGPTIGVDSVRWSFGDGNGASGTPALHTYAESNTYTVCVFAYSQCGNDTFCTSVVYHSTVGVSSSLTAAITVYPNPTDSRLIVENASEYQLAVMNVLGQEVIKITSPEGKQIIDLSPFADGVYELHMTGTMDKKTFRVIKR